MIRNEGFLRELALLVTEMKAQNQDLMISIFGSVGSGKSTLAINIAKVVDSTFKAESLSTRMAHTKEDFAFKQSELNAFETIIWDEAHKLQRRSQWDEWNKRYLDYFSDSRGLNQVTILCFPNLEEIDRNIVERSRLFLQTYRKGNKYGVMGWTKKQVRAKLRESKLAAPRSIEITWAKAGGRHPKINFSHDMAGIEEELKVYTELKKQNLARTKANLAVYGSLAIPDLSLEIATISKYTTGHIHDIACEVVRDISQKFPPDVLLDDLERLPAGWAIKTSRMKQWIGYEIIQRLRSLTPKKKHHIITQLKYKTLDLISVKLQEGNNKPLQEVYV